MACLVKQSARFWGGKAWPELPKPLFVFWLQCALWINSIPLGFLRAAAFFLFCPQSLNSIIFPNFNAKRFPMTMIPVADVLILPRIEKILMSALMQKMRATKPQDGVFMASGMDSIFL